MPAFDIKFEGINVQTHPVGKRGRVVTFSNVTEPEAEEMARQIVNTYPEINVGGGWQEGFNTGLGQGWDDGWDACLCDFVEMGERKLWITLNDADVDPEVLLAAYKKWNPEAFKKIAEEK